MKYERHGMYGTPEYSSWESMRTRCLNKNHVRYKDYGGRGIKICEQWLDSFKTFYEDMGPRPSLKHSIDRIDNNGNYEPLNCKWSTNKQQYRNRRSNRIIKYKNQEKTITEWAEELNLSCVAIRLRIKKGWSIKDALEKPLRVTSRTKARAKLKEWQ